jgi:ribonuclease P protein component
VVVYLARTAEPTRFVGFAVSKAVGGAVVRNRVRRRLRAIIAGELPTLPAGARVVVRALPAAATAPFAALSSDVHSALATACARAAA